MNPDDDSRDPLRAAFTDYTPAPRDVVPRSSSSTVEELHAIQSAVSALIPMADTTQAVTHYEMTADGITKCTERVTITRPITPKEGTTP